jgi:hypothetical protein
MPFLKVPLNAVGDIVNKAGAVAVLPLVVKMFADQFVVQPEFAAATGWLFPAAFAGEAGAMGAAASGIGWLLAAAVGVLVYGAVWLTFNVFDVLILICPCPGVDAALKSLRLSIVGLLAGLNHISPGAALFLAAMVTGMSLFLAGWSFRLSVFGLVFSTDILFFRKAEIDASCCRAFSCGKMKVDHNIPMRTWGTLRKTESGELAFSYRPWLVLGKREAALGGAAGFSAGRGLLNPFLVGDGESNTPWLRLPPRYRGREEAMAERLGLGGVVSCGVGGAFRAWLGEFFGAAAT